jgi:deazaflavin-dependent oxidoreductase (nitroreductase family)
MADAMKTTMRLFGRLNTAVYRATKGRLWSKIKGMPILLLTVKGRKSGKLRTTPVVYFQDGRDYVVTGSANGRPIEPDWFRNLRAADTVSVEIGGFCFEATITVADPEQRAQLWTQLMKHGPFFEDYQAKTERQIPMAVLTPR